MRHSRAQKKIVAATVTILATLGLTSCAEAEADIFMACMVADTGGLDDKAFNSAAWEGMRQAVATEYEIQISNKTPADADQYNASVEACVTEENADVTVTTGFQLGESTEKYAKEYKDRQFAIVDFNLVDAGVYSMEFNTAQPSFLAGYLAAGYSKSKKVGTFGGMQFPSVTAFMDGFAEGVDYYNEEKGTNVELFGWNPEKQEGKFLESFTDTSLAKEVTQEFMDDGADVIFPVAGLAGLGSAQLTEASGGEAKVVWVDVDGCISAEAYCDQFLTTVEKNLTLAVQTTVLASFDQHGKGKPQSTHYIGTLANKGVGLADYHPSVEEDESLVAEIEKVREKIVSGEIKLKSVNQPVSSD